MTLRGDLPASYARPMAAVFADTGFEPKRVYEHLHWLIEMLGTELPVHIVRAMRPDGTPAHNSRRHARVLALSAARRTNCKCR